MKYRFDSSDGIFQGPYVEAGCQAYMDLYGAYEDKKPFPREEKYLNEKIGKTEFKNLRTRIKDSCKEIRNVFSGIKPKHYRDDLPDDEE